jgi:hypothetical protein
MIMNKKKLLSTTIATIFATGIVATGAGSSFAMAQTPTAHAVSKDQTTSAKTDPKTKKAEQDLVKVSQDALLSMRDIRNARLALFDGDTDQAQTYVDAAKTRIDIANNEANKYALDIKAPKADDSYVPYDTALTVMDSFEPKQTKARHTPTSRKRPHHSKQKKGEETLKLSDTDVVLSTDMIPVDFARQHINEASSLVKEGKYYEANLALKAVDDSVFIQTYALENVPKVKGDQSKAGDNKTQDAAKDAKG